MDIYAFVAQKGGVGKTTLAGHLAVEAARVGSVVLVDTDPQGSLGHWWEARAEDQLHFADAQTHQLPALLKQWQDSGVKAVFLDTPPAISETIREVVQLSDLVVVPTKPSPHDLRAVVGTMELVEKYNKPVVFVVNAAVMRARLTGQAAVALSQYGTVAPVTVHHRVAFAASMIDGRVARELNGKSRSAEEITLLWKYVNTLMRKERKMAKAAGLDTVLPGTKKKGEPDAPALKTVARKTAERTKALTVKVSPELYRRLRLHALDSDMSHQNILVAALEQYLR